MVLDDGKPWDGILASTIVALRATVHTTTQYIPAQFLFGRDSILNIRDEANWHLIKKRKRESVNDGNQQEIRNRKEHTYNKGDKVLFKMSQKLNSTKMHTWVPAQS